MKIVLKDIENNPIKVYNKNGKEAIIKKHYYDPVKEESIIYFDVDKQKTIKG